MKLTLALFVLTAILARAEDAAACSCARPRVTHSPHDTDAPINSTVVVWVPSYVAKGNVVNLSLRKKTSDDTIAVDYKSMGAADMKVIEMTPRAKLDPNTEYEIVLTDKDASAPVGSFTTGTRKLKAATPPFLGVAKANYYKDKPICCICNTADPYADIELSDTIGDKRAKEVRLAIWMAGADGKIDYKKPPVTYEYGAQRLWLGHPSTCAPANFTFPKTKNLKFGLKLVDLAGNASAPSEFVLDTTKPLKPPAN
jgi:hypothetical protein